MKKRDSDDEQTCRSSRGGQYGIRECTDALSAWRDHPDGNIGRTGTVIAAFEATCFSYGLAEVSRVLHSTSHVSCKHAHLCRGSLAG
jgi:hypothetical protein